MAVQTRCCSSLGATQRTKAVDPGTIAASDLHPGPRGIGVEPTGRQVGRRSEQDIGKRYPVWHVEIVLGELPCLDKRFDSKLRLGEQRIASAISTVTVARPSVPSGAVAMMMALPDATAVASPGRRVYRGRHSGSSCSRQMPAGSCAAGRSPRKLSDHFAASAQAPGTPGRTGSQRR